MKKMVVRTDPYGFGIIVPMKTGVIWEHQCDGYACNQLQQEGIFLPLKERYFDSEIDYLGDKNYYYTEEKLPFRFKFITFDKVKFNSSMQMFMHEAYDWIIFECWKNKDYEAKEWDNLIGKKVLLIYPNSD